MIIPFIFFVLFMLTLMYLGRIQKQLYPQILEEDDTLTKPEELNFNVIYETVDPFALYSTFP